MFAKKIRFFLGILAAALTLVSLGKLFPAQAQAGPLLLVTWRAGSYVPPDFRGKALPPRGGSITVSVDLLVNGRPADLSNREIRWFIENELYRSGKNLKRLTFTIPIQNSDGVTVKAVVIGTTSGNLERTISIPVASPVLSIDAPSKGGYIPAASIAVRAIPYFFSIEKPDDLSFVWLANGSPVGEGIQTPSAITFDASGGAPGNSVILGVRAVNPNAAVESARASVSLRIK